MVSCTWSNMWGNDKVSLEDREKWSYDNLEWIKECAQDPIANRKWEDADNPFQFLAFVMSGKIP